jgi:hypothetical protein
MNDNPMVGLRLPDVAHPRPEPELPRPEKRRRVEEENQYEELQNSILTKVNEAIRPPAKIKMYKPLPSDMVYALTVWAHRFGYVLHYKEKTKHIRENLSEKKITIELYWVKPYQ